MKKLLLASSGLTYIKQFVGQEPSSMHMLFIPTAGNLDSSTWWIDKDRDVLSKMGFVLHELDIAEASPREQKEVLTTANIVYVAGGNTFYLLKQLRISGFDTLLTTYVNDGGLYVGASAGALVAGKDIEPIRTLDKPEKVEGLASTHALGLIDIVPIPHYDFGNRKTKVDNIEKAYADKFKIVVLTDDQAILVTGDTYRLVDSPRSELEMQWLHNSHDPELDNAQ